MPKAYRTTSDSLASQDGAEAYERDGMAFALATCLDYSGPPTRTTKVIQATSPCRIVTHSTIPAAPLSP